MIREAAVAGQFYPRNPGELKAVLASFLKGAKDSKPCPAVVSPHAGYVYSGRTAAKAVSCLEKAGTYVILSPNHTGLGEEISVYPKGKWRTPLGEIEVDDELASVISRELGIERDELAHLGEHAIEVQLPMLQFLHGNSFRIVPITLAEHGFNELAELGKVIAEKSEGKSVALIASSDFTHFEPEENAKKKDLEAIKLIEKLDAKSFHSLVLRNRLSICGFAGIVSAIEYAKKTGCGKAELLAYDSSATASGDRSSVVGYAALAFRK